MNARRDHLLSVSLAYSIGVLALVLVAEIMFFAIDFGKWMPSDQLPFEFKSTLSTNVRALGDPEDFQGIADRPLFVWNRRPIPVTKELGVTQPDMGSIDSRWGLSAVISSGGTVYAYFNETEGDLTVRLQEGMFLEEWLVESIHGESVTLVAGDVDEGEGDDERTIFRLKEVSDSPKTSKRSRANKTNRTPVSRRSVKQAPKNSVEVGSEDSVNSKRNSEGQ